MSGTFFPIKTVQKPKLSRGAFELIWNCNSPQTDTQIYSMQNSIANSLATVIVVTYTSQPKVFTEIYKKEQRESIGIPRGRESPVSDCMPRVQRKVYINKKKI